MSQPNHFEVVHLIFHLNPTIGEVDAELGLNLGSDKKKIAKF